MTYLRVLVPLWVDVDELREAPDELRLSLDELRAAPEPEEVRWLEDERVDVELAGADVRVLFVDSRLTVVVRPDASVDLMVVRVVPDLLTRLSTVVEG